MSAGIGYGKDWIQRFLQNLEPLLIGMDATWLSYYWLRIPKVGMRENWFAVEPPCQPQ